MNNANCIASNPLNLKANSIGIVVSLLIHGGIILLILLAPVSGMIPRTQIIQLNLEQSDTPSINNSARATKQLTVSKINQRQKKISPESLLGPLPLQKEILQNKPVLDQQQRMTKTTLTTGKSVDTADGNSETTTSIPAEDHVSAATNQTITTKMEGQGIVDFKFGEIGAPVFLHKQMPVYPMLAKRLGKEGKVILKLLIDVNGKLQNVEVIQAAGFGFTESAVEAVKNSTYSPAYRNGEKVPTKALLPVRFHLQD